MGGGDDRRASLHAKARGLPPVPGVYLMKDARGIVIYVGKALRLPDRVSSYFLPSADLGVKKSRMVELIDDFDTVECESEWEALLAENRLIKDLKPRFNAMLTDGKSFPYLAITVRDEFPRVEITRSPGRLRGARIVGPFLKGGALRHAIETVQGVFRFRTCSLDIRSDDPRNRFFRPCLLHAIGRCSAPCAARITPERYRDDIDRFARFIDSRQNVMLREMRDDMARAADARDYERAAILRDQIRALEGLAARATVRERWQPETELSPIVEPAKALRSLARTLGADSTIRVIEGIDIAHLQGRETVGAKVCFVDARPFKDAYRRYRIESAANDDFASIREVVSRRYRDAGEGQELFPDVILIDGGSGQLSAALQAFEPMRVRPPIVLALAKKEELIHLLGRDEPIRLGRENPGLRLLQAVRDEAHRFAQHYHHVLRRKSMLEEDE